MHIDCPLATLSPSFTNSGSPGAGRRKTVPDMGAVISIPDTVGAAAGAGAAAALGAAGGGGAAAAGAAYAGGADTACVTIVGNDSASQALP
jgi:hypothetical protein